MKTIRYLHPMTEYSIPKITQESTLSQPGISEVTLKPIEILEKNTLTSLSNLRTLKIGEGTKELVGDAIETVSTWKKFIFRTV